MRRQMSLMIDYLANHQESGKPRSGVCNPTALTQNPKFKSVITLQSSLQNNRKQTFVAGTGSKISSSSTDSTGSSLSCWLCGGPHLKRNCPQARQSEASAGVQPPRRVNKVSARSADTVVSDAALDNSHVIPAACCEEPCAQSVNRVKQTVAVESQEAEVAHDFVTASDSHNTCESVDSPVRFDLRYLPVLVTVPNSNSLCGDDSESVSLFALEDSGAEIAVIRENVQQQLGFDNIHCIGKVTLSGITGTPITCPLVRLQD